MIDAFHAVVDENIQKSFLTGERIRNNVNVGFSRYELSSHLKQVNKPSVSTIEL